MTCDEARKRILELPAGEAPEDLASHLEQCADCARAYESQRALDGLLRPVGTPPVEADLWPAIRSQLRPRRLTWPWVLAPVAGVAAGIALALLFASPTVAPTSGPAPLAAVAMAAPAEHGADDLDEDAQIIAWHARAAAGTGLFDPSSMAITLISLTQGGSELN